MANFRKVNDSPAIEAPKRGRPAGAKNKPKGVAQAKPKGSVYQGTYGRVNGIVSVELLDGMKSVSYTHLTLPTKA